MSHTPAPPPAEVYELKPLAERHPHLLPQNRLRWAARHRRHNGLEAAGAVFESPTGVLLFYEPAVIQWLLGLSGRSKPRAGRRAGARSTRKFDDKPSVAGQ
jgi:hypothetical protein